MAPSPVLLPGKSHGWRSLVGCSPWGCEESDTTELLTHQNYNGSDLAVRPPWINPTDEYTSSYTKSTSARLFASALFVIAKDWKPPRCPSKGSSWIHYGIWNKITSYSKTRKKIKHKKFSQPFGLLSPATVHYVSALNIDQTSPFAVTPAQLYRATFS